jgi:bacterioferritin-associated ferredoxin
MVVDRCYCCNVRFKELLALAREEGLDARKACERLRCGGQCGLCVPYIREAFRTGKTDLPVDPRPPSPA